MISITLPIAPVPKGRPRFFNGICTTPPETRKFERDVQRLLRIIYSGKPLDGPLIVDIDFHLPPPKRVPKDRKGRPACKPDLDNLVKAVTDACNGILWHDDGQIVGMYITKKYGPPGILIEVGTLP